MDTLIYLHIPKTAGTSFDEVLRANYGDAYHRVKNYGARESFWSDGQAGKNYRCIGGHITFGVHGSLVGDCRYIAFVRDPLERMLSLYGYISRKTVHALHPFVVSKTFGEWVLSDIFADADNGLVRFFSGRMQFGIRPLGRSVTECDYQRAIANIEKWFDYVGVFEELEQSVDDLGLLYGWRHLDMPHLLNGAGRLQASEIEPDLRDEFTERNRWDYALYAYVLTRFTYGGNDEK